MKKLQEIIVSPNITIREVLKIIDKSSKQIALVDDARRVVGLDIGRIEEYERANSEYNGVF